MVTSRAFRILIYVVLLVLGLALVAFARSAGNPLAREALDKVGMGFIVTGILTILFDTLGSRGVVSEFDRVAAEVRREVRSGVERVRSLSSVDVEVLEPKRSELAEYNEWLEPGFGCQRVYLVGRSVMHAIARRMGDDEFIDAVVRKLWERDVEVSIAFLDPRAPFMQQLMREEGPGGARLPENICASLEICEDLAKQLGKKPERLKGSIKVVLYSMIPYFAFHRVDEKMILGFYYYGQLGQETSPLRIRNKDFEHSIKVHIDRIFAAAESEGRILLAAGRNVEPTFNEALFDACVGACKSAGKKR